MLDILALSGSLRAASLNTALLRAAQALAPAGMTIEIYEGLGALPLFNPDLDPRAFPNVTAFLIRAAQADALLIACPEYARGIPGAFKNALDWLVGCEDFGAKKVALLNASARATAAQDALRLVLTTMAMEIVEPASVTVPLAGAHGDPAAILADAEIAARLASALETLAEALAA
ncbi:NADPH-dependent FMN reductase [Dongia rigui]|uniref:NADPH-dependent FMN reductase n=1 Tax=Dongia rigui TaxID=940149 RepID=A0ABU5DWD1_9PROT|nr:NADPH-dependent FMN reductase [Dongia rigui]MDY0871613.1 NADPH-dependent FMN reductase [Dongia rigui]